MLRVAADIRLLAPLKRNRVLAVIQTIFVPIPTKRLVCDTGTPYRSHTQHTYRYHLLHKLPDPPLISAKVILVHSPFSMALRIIPISAPSAVPEPSLLSSPMQLLSCLISTSKPDTARNHKMGQGPNLEQLHTTTVVQMGEKAFAIRSQFDVR